MSSETLIDSIELERLDLSLNEPFGISGGTHEHVRNVLVTVRLGNGTIGLGEAAPLPPFNGETQESTLDALKSVRSKLIGRNAAEWRPIGLDLRLWIPEAGSARCALETAILDSLSRSRALSLWHFFGGFTRELVTDITIPLGDAAHAKASAKNAARNGFRTIKIKVGGASIEADVDRIISVREAAPDAVLTLDANAGLDETSAERMMRLLRQEGIPIALLEEPLPAFNLRGMRRLFETFGVPIAADESVSRASDVARIADSKAAQYMNIKLMKSGIVEALDIAATSRALGLGLMIGGMVESKLAMTCSACFAAGQGGFTYVDLDTPMFLADDPFSGGYEQGGDRLDVSTIQNGLGVSRRL